MATQENDVALAAQAADLRLRAKQALDGGEYAQVLQLTSQIQQLERLQRVEAMSASLRAVEATLTARIASMRSVRAELQRAAAAAELGEVGGGQPRAAGGPAAGRREADGPHQFLFEGKPDSFSPLYLQSPARNTAACNAGDYFLYLGGGSINGAFGKLLSSEHGLEMDTEFHPRKSPVQMEYMELHQRLLKASRERGGELTVASELASAIPEVTELMKKVYLADSFCVSGEAYGEEDPRYAQAVGSAFLDVYEETSRPLHNRNVAMLYVVGPKGEGSKAGQGPLLPTDEFLSSVRRLGGVAVKLVVDYNARCAVEGAGRLPRVEEIRWCLVSGGVYKPPDVTKEEVARATLAGMNAVEGKPIVTFTYDDDVFRVAFEAPTPTD